MSDTQWPRYEVFKQDSERKVHEAVGSVHAPDLEMALLHARDVFVRRPSAVSLWVVAERDIFTMTAEELAQQPEWAAEEISANAALQPFHIFTKTSQRRSMTYVKYVDDVVAPSVKQALQQALQDPRFEPETVFAWWVVPQTAVLRSEDDAIKSWFEPAKDKTYRQQSYYGFVGLRKKQGGQRHDTTESA